MGEHMSKRPDPPSRQLALPGLTDDQVHDDPEGRVRQAQHARRPPRRAEAQPDQANALRLPPVASFDGADALAAAIAQLEPYLAELKRRRGNLIGAKRSAQVRAFKRPSRQELEAFFPDRYGNEGALDKAAKHFQVNRRTISRWRALDRACS